MGTEVTFNTSSSLELNGTKVKYTSPVYDSTEVNSKTSSPVHGLEVNSNTSSSPVCDRPDKKVCACPALITVCI